MRVYQFHHSRIFREQRDVLYIMGPGLSSRVFAIDDLLKGAFFQGLSRFA